MNKGLIDFEFKGLKEAGDKAMKMKSTSRIKIELDDFAELIKYDEYQKFQITYQFIHQDLKIFMIINDENYRLDYKFSNGHPFKPPTVKINDIKFNQWCDYSHAMTLSHFILNFIS